MKKTRYIWLMAALMTSLAFLAGCSSDGGGGSDEPQPAATTAPIILTIATPNPSNTGNQNANTRVGDPGEGGNETYADWNRLTIIVAYTQKETGKGIVDPNPEKMVYMDTFTKKEFDSTTDVIHEGSVLSPSSLVDGYHEYTMYLPLGKVKVYGVTYSVNDKDDEGSKDTQNLSFNPETAKLSNTSDIEALTISNDYAGSDQKKFLSVATGYASVVKPGASNNGSRELTIIKGNDMEMKQYWQMPLTRLATKLDIQWDAKGAYEKKDDQGNLVYTDVKVSKFTYNGGAKFGGTSSLTGNGTSDSGWGRLFPTLQEGNVQAIGGSKTFINTSEISKRNGRQYHYFFPDGSKSPSMTFTLTTQKQGKSETESKEYTFRFDETNVLPLKPGAWYKINTTISGQSNAETNITVGK